MRKHGSAPKCECWVYPRGNREGTVFYLEDGDIYICELSRHGDQSYERLTAAGIKRKDYDLSQFTELTE